MIKKSIWAALFGILMLTVFPGCQSLTPPITYYTLSPIKETADENVAANHQALVIGIRPVQLPGTIDRTQMVIRSGPHRLVFSSLNRWADYPYQLVQQTIEENLQTLMPSARLVSAPWPIGLKPDITVTVKFHELIGTDADTVLLSAIWTITAADPGRTDSYRLNLTEPMVGNGYDELAAAHSRVLAAFCRKMADSLRGGMEGARDPAPLS